MSPKWKLALTIDTLVTYPSTTNLQCRAEYPRHIQCHSPPLRHKDTEIVRLSANGCLSKTKVWLMKKITWIEIHFDSLGQRKGSKEGQLASKKDSNSIYFCNSTLSKCEQWLFSYSFTPQVWFNKCEARKDSWEFDLNQVFETKFCLIGIKDLRN